MHEPADHEEKHAILDAMREADKREQNAGKK